MSSPGRREQLSHTVSQASSVGQRSPFAEDFEHLPIAPEENFVYRLYKTFDMLSIRSFCPTEKVFLTSWAKSRRGQFFVKHSKISCPGIPGMLVSFFFFPLADLLANICCGIPLLGITPVCLASNVVQYIHLARKYTFV